MTPGYSRRTFLATGLALAPALVLGGCGFHLRGPQPLAYATLYVGADPNSALGAALRRRVANSGTTLVVEDPAAADARIEFLQIVNNREILSLSGAGKVREYQIEQVITFRVISRAGIELLPATSISARREYNFDDTRVIGKEQEEALLYRDIETDLLQQLMRRLAALRP